MTDTDAPTIAVQERKGTFDEFITTLMWAALLAVAIRSLLFEPFSIPSGSMKPTLQEGDFLFVNKFVYGYSRYSFPFGMGPVEAGTRLNGTMPERGDIIVFKLPSNPSIDFIKRVVGLPGDKIQVIDGHLYINGEMIERQEIGTESTTTPMGFPETMTAYKETLPNGALYTVLEESDDGPLDNTPVFTVPEDFVFCMGDNRDNSQDSRVAGVVGFIPMENIVGKAERIFFSVDGQGVSLWQIWKWPGAIRFDRIFSDLEPEHAD